MASLPGAPPAPPAPSAPGGSMGDSLRNRVSSITSQGPAVSIAVVITLLLIIGVLIYLVWRYVRRDQDSYVIIQNARRLDNQPAALTVTDGKLPVTSNGQQWGYSFWVYLPSVRTSDTTHLLFQRGAGLGSTAVFMDSTTNKMYIAVKTNGDVLPATTTHAKLVSTPTSTYLVATVEYVPLQRWVHIAFTVQDAQLTVYMDGDPYTIESATDKKKADGTRVILEGQAGDLVVGAPNALISGYLGRMLFFNYALTQPDVTKLYNNGPRGSTAMGALGLASYGVRSPIYRMDDKVDN